MKKNKIFLIVMAFCVMLSIGISVFAVAYAAADDGKTVQLVTLDYIENSLMKQIEEKIRPGSVESMKESIGQINQMLDYLNTQTAANAGNQWNLWKVTPSAERIFFSSPSLFIQRICEPLEISISPSPLTLYAATPVLTRVSFHSLSRQRSSHERGIMPGFLSPLR